MPHVALVPFTGLRVRESEMLKLGMTLPGLKKRAEAIGSLPALGLLTLAGMTPSDWSCSYHPSAETETLIDDVIQTQPDLVAVSALTASVLEAYEFCNRLKPYGIPTVIGGLHATVLPDEAGQHADAVCIKDGESSWLKILEDVQNQRLKKKYMPDTPFDLANSPTPRFDLLDSGTQPQRWMVQTQRGCPWGCEFCGASRLLGPARFKPAGNVARELSSIAELDSSPWVELADDNTLAGRRDSFQLLESISQANIKYFTESDWRIGEDRKLLQAMAESGCVQVLVGIESLTFRYPGMGKKQMELAQVADAIQAIQDAGIVVNGCFIVGADGETQKSIDQMQEFIESSSLAEVQVTLQTPFPGTGLYQRMKQSGRLLPDRDWSFYTLFDLVYQPDLLTPSELESGFKRIILNTFSESSSARRDSMRRQIWRKHPGSKTRN